MVYSEKRNTTVAAPFTVCTYLSAVVFSLNTSVGSNVCQYGFLLSGFRRHMLLYKNSMAEEIAGDEDK